MNPTDTLTRLLLRRSHEMQTVIADTARAVQADPTAFPANVSVYFGPFRREDGTAAGENTARAFFNVVQVIGGATHEELLMAYDAADRRQPGFPGERGQMVEVRRDGRLVVDVE